MVLTGGLSALLLAVFYYVIDVQRHRTWCLPFVWIGCNATTIYVVEQVVKLQSVAARLVGGDVQRFLDGRVAPGCGAVVIAFVGLLLAVLLTRFLYRRNLLLRL